jgi:hypothetical protein
MKRNRTVSIFTYLIVSHGTMFQRGKVANYLFAIGNVKRLMRDFHHQFNKEYLQ